MSRNLYRFILCLLVFVMIPIMAWGENAPNLITNGGFENLKNDQAIGWSITSYVSQEGVYRAAVTDEKAYTGTHSALIENASLNDTRFVWKTAVEPSSLYYMSAYVLVENMAPEGNGANLALEDLYATSKSIFETSDQWQKIEWYGETGPDQREVAVGLRLGGYSSESEGKVYFDEVVLQKVDSLPAGISATLWYSAYAGNASNVTALDDTADKSTTLFFLVSFVFVGLFVWLSQMLDQKESKADVFFFVCVLLFGLLLRLYVASNVAGYEVDINCFTAWSQRMAMVGPSGFYAPDYFCDYPPGYLLLLWPVGILLQVIGYGHSSLQLLVVKILPILFDLLGAGLLYFVGLKMASKRKAFIVSALYFLSPAVLATGVAWGQGDSVFAFCMMLTVLFAMRKQWQVVFPLFVVSVLVKPQALMYGPVGLIWIVLCFLKTKKENRNTVWKQMGIGFAIALSIACLVVIPFTPKGTNTLSWIVGLYGETLSSYAYVNLNTANLTYLLSENWAPLTKSMDLGLTIGMMGLGLAMAGWCYRKPNEASKEQKLFALYGILVAIAGLVCLLVGTSYALYGYLVIALMVSYAGLCLFVHQEVKNLPFYLSLSLIGMYVLGTKMHERYLYSGIALLFFSYLTTNDKRVLWLAVGWTITTFINTAIVLDNAILFGAAQGHLNDDTLIANGLLSVINVALCACALFLGSKGLRASVPKELQSVATEKTKMVYQKILLSPCDDKWSLRLKDYLIMAVVTILYSIVCFAHLGSTVAPQEGWIATSSEEKIVFQMEKAQDFSFRYYGGINHTNFMIAVSEDGETWSEEYPMNMNQGLCYRWNVGLKASTVDGVVTYTSDGTNNVLWLKGKYIRLSVKSAGLSLWEVVAVDTEGNVIPLTIADHSGANPQMLVGEKPVSHLIDEQDTYVGDPSWYNGMYFDEIYHARTAYEHLHGQVPYETTHPPLGKLMMSVSIAIFGMTPFGWRFAGAFVGVLMLPVMYLLGIQLWKRRDLATVSMIALSLDLMHFTQTRIATIDSFPVFFIMLSYLCMIRYVQWDIFALKEGEVPKLWTASFAKSLIPLALSGIAMGLSIASKWVGLYSAVGLALLYFITLYRQYRASNEAFEQEETPRIINARNFTLSRIGITCALCVLFFVLVPALIYYVSYIPYLAPSGEVSLKRIVDAQQGMLNYHSTPGLGEDHPFHSPWWQWPFILKPMWFAMDAYEPFGYASTILCMGNPWIFYLAAFAMLFVLIAFGMKQTNTPLGRKIQTIDSRSVLLVLSIGFLAQYLPWVLVPRGMYIYHYFASVPFIILATVFCMGLIPKEKKWLRYGIMTGYLLMALLFFVLFFPYASGVLTPTSWLDAVKWFPNLYY